LGEFLVLVTHLPTQLPHFRLEVLILETSGNSGVDFRHFEWLDDIVLSATTKCIDRGLDARVAGHYDDLGVWGSVDDGIDDFEAVGVAKREVDQGHVDFVYADCVERLFAGAGGDRVILELRQ
jgi:hypothetical protein